MRSYQDQYLTRRGGQYQYVRRVPQIYQKHDTRRMIRRSLRTDSIKLARKRRDALAKADDLYWESLAVDKCRDGTSLRYEAARKRAMAHGFAYKPIDELADTATLEEIVKRVLRLSQTPNLNKNDVQAVLGGAKRPSMPISKAFELYCKEIAVGDLLGKSEAQLKLWRKVKLRAVNYFIDLNGDIPMDKITREHARKVYNWWAERLRPKGDKKPLSPNSANRDIGNLRKLYSEYWTYEGEEDRENPFRKLSFSDKSVKDVPHFEDEFVQQRILRPEIFKGLNPQATLLIYILIETGCRPSEIANLRPEDIVLNVEAPHIKIRPKTDRQLKSASSLRDIPLVGVSLEAFKLSPQGFPHYRDKGSLLSAALMKAFRHRHLFPTKDHRIYSFRHSFEKRMLEAGLDYGLRCSLMGHKNSRPKYGDGGSMIYRQGELLKIAHPVPDGFTNSLAEITRKI